MTATLTWPFICNLTTTYLLSPFTWIKITKICTTTLKINNWSSRCSHKFPIKGSNYPPFQISGISFELVQLSLPSQLAMCIWDLSLGLSQLGVVGSPICSDLRCRMLLQSILVELFSGCGCRHSLRLEFLSWRTLMSKQFRLNQDERSIHPCRLRLALRIAGYLSLMLHIGGKS